MLGKNGIVSKVNIGNCSSYALVVIEIVNSDYIVSTIPCLCRIMDTMSNYFVTLATFDIVGLMR